MNELIVFQMVKAEPIGSFALALFIVFYALRIFRGER